MAGAHIALLKNKMALDLVGVEALTSYFTSPRKMAASLQFTYRIQYVQMDFSESPVSIELAALVILDRVICCYPHLENLLAAAAARVRRYLAFSYLLEDWWVQVF